MFEVEFIEEEALDIMEVPLAMRSEVSLQEARRKSIPDTLTLRARANKTTHLVDRQATSLAVG
jgi:hypothetical protein